MPLLLSRAALFGRRFFEPVGFEFSRDAGDLEVEQGGVDLFAQRAAQRHGEPVVLQIEQRSDQAELGRADDNIVNLKKQDVTKAGNI